jgi:hypothetical protein
MIDGAGLWYGGILLLAIIMIVLVFRAARRNASPGLRERFTERKWAKVKAAKLQPKETLPARAEGACYGTSLKQWRA